jgi:hypothetical protein
MVKKYIILCLLQLGLICQAQDSTGVIKGTVNDAIGDPLPAIKIVLFNNSGSYVSEAMSNGDGTYLFEELPLGLYQLQVIFFRDSMQVLTQIPVQYQASTYVNFDAFNLPEETIAMRNELFGTSEAKKEKLKIFNAASPQNKIPDNKTVSLTLKGSLLNLKGQGIYFYYNTDRW